MHTETTRPHRKRKPRRKPVAKPLERAAPEDESTPHADELVVQGDRGFDDGWTRVDPDPEATPW